MFTIILIFLLLGLIYLVYRLWKDSNFLTNQFKRNNVLVFGQKGTGKDLVFNKVIKKRKKPYLSNINYGGDFQHIQLQDLSLGENTFENFINGDITMIPKKIDWVGKDIYMSDLGVYLPSHYNHLLDKKYPSLPIFMALQRHLYQSNMHGNSQALMRTWNKFREQGDGYFRARISFKVPFLPIFITRGIYYAEYESALKSLLPMKTRGLSNDTNRALIEQHRATYGLIKNLFIVNFVPKYDTHHFHKMIFGSTLEEWKKERKLISDSFKDKDLKAKSINNDFFLKFKSKKNKKAKK